MLSPDLTLQDSRDRGSCNLRILSGYSSSGHSSSVKAADALNIFCGELRAAMILSAWVIAAALGFHVVDVVALTSQEQMFDVDAKPVVALVADAQVFGIFTPKENPGNSMRELRSSHESYGAVASTPGSSPKQAAVFVRSDLVKKTGLSGFKAEAAMSSPSHGSLYIYSQG